MEKVAIACGGSGGHLFPGIAIAEELKERNVDCVLVISNKPIDSTIVKKYSQFEHVIISARPFSKKRIISFAWSQFVSIFTCIKFLWKNKIKCVIGMGGFTNLPLVMAAYLLHRKIVLHESNVVIGKSIKFLAPFANTVFLHDGASFSKSYLQKKVINSDVPLRKEIKKITKEEARAILGLPKDVKLVTVLGGSQGANPLNMWALENLKKLNDNGISVYCVCGPKNFEKTTNGEYSTSTRNDNVINTFLPFCDNVPVVLSATDVLVCRAGAGTIAEASALMTPMILVPYPHAAEKHQDANAEHAKMLGHAIVISENNMPAITGAIFDIFSSNFSSFSFTKNENTATRTIADKVQELTR